MGDFQKPQRPRKREEELGLKRHNWKDWEKNHNHLTGLTYNKLYDVYQQNENERVRSQFKIQGIQKEINKMEKLNRKQIETLREDYKVMMAYAYVYKLHSMGQDPDNDEIPLIRKRLKVKPAQPKPKDPDLQLLPDDILEYYDERPKSFRLPSVAPKWRPASFSGNPFVDNQTPSESEPWINDPYPTLKAEDIIFVKKERPCDHDENENDDSKETFIRLPAIGTLTLKLANWKTFGKQNAKCIREKPPRNAMSEPPSRWRGRENLNKINRPKSFIPDTEFSCKTVVNTKKFYDEEAKKSLPKMTATHKRLKEAQHMLQKINNPLNDIIDSRKSTSAILKEYRQKQQEQKKKGPMKASLHTETDKKQQGVATRHTQRAKEGEVMTKRTPKMIQNWIIGNQLSNVSEE